MVWVSVFRSRLNRHRASQIMPVSSSPSACRLHRRRRLHCRGLPGVVPGDEGSGAEGVDAWARCESRECFQKAFLDRRRRYTHPLSFSFFFSFCFPFVIEDPILCASEHLTRTALIPIILCSRYIRCHRRIGKFTATCTASKLCCEG